MTTKTRAIPEQDLFPLLLSIKKRKLQVYASLLYWLAARAGELLPYEHYKTTYKRDSEGKLIRDDKGHCIVETREKLFSSPGIPVSTIVVHKTYIEFNQVPVFKSKKGFKETDYKTGIVPKAKNPVFESILSYVIERKAVQQKVNEEAENSGSPPATIFLFEPEVEDVDGEHFFWRFKKQLDRVMNAKGFSTHSLRKTRATKAGNDSGDAYYVQSITGHASINMASEYVAKKRLLDNMKKYEGI